MRRLLFAVSILFAPPLLAQPAALEALLACRDALALNEAVAVQEARYTSQAQCRSHRRGAAVDLQCEPRVPLKLFGLPLREFSLHESAARGHVATSVLRASLNNARDAAQKSLRGVFEPEGAEYYRLNLGDGLSLRLGEREDGAAELACEAAPADLQRRRRDGVDAAHGAVGGKVSFPGKTLPAMLVCAVPVRPRSSGNWCVISAENNPSYHIGNIPAGEYYLLAWPRGGNPNHFVAAHARSLQDCPPASPGCASGVLETVWIGAGAVQGGINLDGIFTTLPGNLAQPPY
ncbi:hypothetical protein [Tahibacter harae]|uniref:Uncharacterized protein n=1 Tax=Tahibacter harae TaxID=2963937 RepID=A0ABT1QVC1_9GAMM|nr:hypothetical protein [Tahibacter harae]MCQ4166238.1 hypothetical protein [Tahibacter harae]